MKIFGLGLLDVKVSPFLLFNTFQIEILTAGKSYIRNSQEMYVVLSNDNIHDSAVEILDNNA